ncbi:DUF3069 domain-containing protein [Shewanella sp. A32]|uniref:DUF3069 domain-containing protein n=1 Tax=Shewanella sp. A32 TaxID=3031327 RepID=UPI0023B88B21|nr:DUF3069 domain-containing protein [Shewanella sp. A32]MDF0534063.1 DUF3069 domain-containing protein [Shewanella sp. A32]
MSQVDALYREQAHTAAVNICATVLPMAKLPAGLKEAYDSLFEELLADSDAQFAEAWANLPASASKLLPQSSFHGFYIASAWLQLSLIGQQIAEQADSDKAIDEQEYNGIYARIAKEALRESVRKIKKARTDRRLLNSMRHVIGLA